ncbi:response regulator of the LytR/AlgR family protein [Flammeovirgaceae bacterium 311]|nr:response regulator of the LytR/AlgR family protein [Flammeovirgaceae bacterium 311]
MKALIVDDERLARKELMSLLAEHHEVEVVGEAVNADDAYEKIKELQPDLLFLDIQMPGKTGFDLLEMLDKVPTVIFTTAYDEYALKAFEVSALDYLLKPVQPERLQESIKKLGVLASENGRDKDDEEEDDPQLAAPRQHKLGPDDQVFVKDGDRCWFVRLSKVRLFESDGNYIKVYFDHYKPMIHKSLNALDERLDDKVFFRANRKHMINLNWVENIEPWFNGGLMVTLQGGEKVEVSRRQATRFKEMMSL